MKQLKAALLSAAALGFWACSGGGSEATLKVGQFANATSQSSNGLSSRSSALSASNSSEAIASPSAFAFAKIDGLRFSLKEVNFVRASDNYYFNAANWSGGKKLEVGADVSAVSIDEKISVDAGDYKGASVRFDGSYEVKAFCRTATKLVYTTATGVKALDFVSDIDLPSDYDYHKYNFGYLTTAEGAHSTTDTFQEDTVANFTVAANSSVQVSLLVDNSFVVSCYDGTVALAGRNHTPGILSPFGWDLRNGTTEDYFPSLQPAFGLAYVPMFVWVSTDPNEAVPTAETYVSSGDSSRVSGSSLDFAELLVTTAAFKADNTMMAMRSRNFDVQHGTGLWQMYNGFTSSSPGHYDMFNGEWFCEPGYQNCRQVQDRKVVSFARQTDFDAVFSTAIEDGPDCGASLMDAEWGNRARACGPSPTEVHWRRVQR